MLKTSHSNLPHHRVIETRPDWIRGLLVVAVFALTLGMLDLWDHQAELAERARFAERLADVADTRLANLSRAPQVRLEGDKLTCVTLNIDPVWELVAAQKCAEWQKFLRFAAARNP